MTYTAIGQVTFWPRSARVNGRGIGAMTPRHQAVVFDERQHDGVSYQALPAVLVSPFKSALVGWKVRSQSSGEGSEIATMTPYTESTGPRDPGDGFRWVDTNATMGNGVLIIAPAGFKPGDDIMRATSGTLTAVATTSAAELSRVCGPAASPRGFVLYEPKQGWGSPAPGAQPPSAGGWGGYLAAGAAALAVAGVAAWLLWPRH